MDEPHLPAEALGDAPGRGRLRGRRVIVVGAGTRPSDDPEAPIGNGRAIAILCAREGAAVACVDHDELALHGTMSRIAEEGGVAHPVVADVTSEDDCARLVEESSHAFGGVDGLVLNVGGAWGGPRLEGTSAEAWDRTFALNLRSHFLVARAALHELSPAASIVFISSVAGLRPGSQMPAYDSSKAGMVGLCRHVALEGARRHIRANVVAPGLIDTPLGRTASRGRPSRDRTPVPLGRQGTAWEIAHATLWLLSDEASYVTGQTLAVDGGLVLI